MADEQIIKTLKMVGLSDKEARLYFAALVLGPTKIAALALEAGLKRSSAYPLVAELVQRGVLNRELQGIKEYLVAAPPEQLNSILEQRKSEFSKLLPELETLYKNTPKRNSIRSFQGLSGVKAAYEDLMTDLKIGDYYWAISDHSKWRSLDPYFEHLKLRRTLRDLDVRLIFQDTPAARHNLANASRYKEQVRLLAPEVRLETNIIVTPHVVLQHILATPGRVYLLHDTDLVRTQSQYFKLLWQALGQKDLQK